VGVSLISTSHAALTIVGAMLGFMLAVSLPLVFATLFEVAYSRRGRREFPLVVCPCLGSCVILVGIFATLQGAILVMWTLQSVSVESAHVLCHRFWKTSRSELPRLVCVHHGFVKTDWEAGKLECTDKDGHISCVPAFVAAPIFNDKARAEAANPNEIWAWAVMRGQHVDANYRLDGTLCGYLSGHHELDFYLGDYRVAVNRVIKKHGLSLSSTVGNAPSQSEQVPLESRPLVMTTDPVEATYKEQAWLLIASILLCCCPCVGPIPVGAILLYFCWARNERYDGHRVVKTDDYDDDLQVGFAE